LRTAQPSQHVEILGGPCRYPSATLELSPGNMATAPIPASDAEADRGFSASEATLPRLRTALKDGLIAAELRICLEQTYDQTASQGLEGWTLEKHRYTGGQWSKEIKYCELSFTCGAK
jgi:hypothetical protein